MESIKIKCDICDNSEIEVQHYEKSITGQFEIYVNGESVTIDKLKMSELVLWLLNRVDDKKTILEYLHDTMLADDMIIEKLRNELDEAKSR